MHPMDAAVINARANFTHPNLSEWLLFGERGASSNAIASYLAYGRLPGGFNDPADPSDFRRCELLLRSVPTLRKEFHRMAEVSKRWEFLVEKWDEIVASLESEASNVWAGYRGGSAPKTYALMNQTEATK